MPVDDPFSEFGGEQHNPFSLFGGVSTPPSANPNVTKVPAKQWLATYMQSPIYQNRLSNFNAAKPNVQHLLNTPITFNNGATSQYATDSKTGNYGVNIDRTEIAKIKDHPDDILSHELSHSSRNLTPEEQVFIASKNKSDLGYGLYAQYQADVGLGKYLGQYNDYLNSGHGTADDAYHDYRPNENKADLDALRFMMFKKGIYDTSKRNMTMDDFKKAAKDPTIKNSMMFNRLLKQFKPEDIILINNKVAKNNQPSTSQNIT